MKIDNDILINDTINNIKEDRTKASEYMKGNNDLFTNAKFLEIRQKSNEQLVKLISILEKNKQVENEEISDEEMKEIYKQGIE